MDDCSDEVRRLMYANAGASLEGLRFVGGPAGRGRPVVSAEGDLVAAMQELEHIITRTNR